jgi:hypothetical protein
MNSTSALNSIDTDHLLNNHQFRCIVINVQQLLNDPLCKDIQINIGLIVPLVIYQSYIVYTTL